MIRCNNSLQPTIFSALQQDYYGKVLQKTSDLKTNVCMTPARPVPAFIRQALKNVHHEVNARSLGCCFTQWCCFRCVYTDPEILTVQVCFSLRYYGCGLVVPECLEGCRILDLGSGSGRDVYMLSQLVGEKGHVTGIDMTEDQVLNMTDLSMCI